MHNVWLIFSLSGIQHIWELVSHTELSSRAILARADLYLGDWSPIYPFWRCPVVWPAMSLLWETNKKKQKKITPVLLGGLKSQQRFITWIRNGASNCISLSCLIESCGDALGDVNCRTEPHWPESRETQAFVRGAVSEQRFISHWGHLVSFSVLYVHPDLRATILVGFYLRPES